MLTAYVRTSTPRGATSESSEGLHKRAAGDSSGKQQQKRAISTTRKRHRGGFQIMRGEADGMAARNIRSYVPSSTHLPHVDALLTCDLIGLASAGWNWDEWL